MTDRLRFDPDGFVDMDQFGADDEPLAETTADAVHDALMAAAVPLPSPERFEGWIAEALNAGPDGPDTAALVPDETESAPASGAAGMEPVDDVPAPDWPTLEPDEADFDAAADDMAVDDDSGEQPLP